MPRASLRFTARQVVALGFAALATAGADAATSRTVVEFYNAALDHYFISADAAEIANLDGGAFGGAWRRTGGTFGAWDLADAPADTVPVCRFFGTDRYRSDGTRIGPNSHFYTADAAECANTKVAFQSVANDGVSYPAWTFEANAFAVKSPVGGACPAATQPLYRSYNNGARGDPNHHYSTNAAALQAMPAWTFEGLVMCVPPVPTATAVGVPTAGAAASASIGAAGGSLTSPDGNFTLTIPPGALASAVVVGIQPITNLAHGRIGAAYRLTPDGQTFAQPVALTFKYSDQDLPGTGASALGAAFQTGGGYWQWFGTPVVDTTAKSVSVTSNHFSDWSAVKGLQIRPPSKTVLVNGTVALRVVACYDLDSELVDLRYGYECDLDESLVPVGESIAWSVNGVVGGGGKTGTVLGGGSGQATATYSAPAAKPSPNVVAVSAQVDQQARGLLLVSNITIEDTDAWSGTSSYVVVGPTTVGQVVTAQVTWTQSATQGSGIVVYRPTGTANITGTGCVWSPASGVIEPSDGSLTVNYNANPPTYQGAGSAMWPSTLSCTDPTFTVSASAVASFFAGLGGGALAQGTVSPDGKTIEGSLTNGPATYQWKYTRSQ